MKLVTGRGGRLLCADQNFNPHEREARDGWAGRRRYRFRHFNPHEREARDCQCFPPILSL